MKINRLIDSPYVDFDTYMKLISNKRIVFLDQNQFPGKIYEAARFLITIKNDHHKIYSQTRDYEEFYQFISKNAEEIERQIFGLASSGTYITLVDSSHKEIMDQMLSSKEKQEYMKDRNLLELIDILLEKGGLNYI